jgi:hypothetical protein
MNPNPDGTLQEAKNWLADRIEKGVQCPCCSQLAKVYSRSLGASMAQNLILLDQFTAPGEWVKLGDLREQLRRQGLRWVPTRADEAKLRYWGLVELQEGERPDKSKRTGIYRITPAGRAFVRGEIVVPSMVRVYDSMKLGESEAQVSVQQALGKEFDYSNLMRDCREFQWKRTG